MKKALIALSVVFILAGCSKSTQYTQDLTGTWYVYKLTYYSVQQSLDSLANYTITFSSNGQYIEKNVFGTDTTYSPGTWAFQNSYGQLVLTDTTKSQTTYTIFNLTGNSIELLRNGYDRYMRKNP
jgi:uncharacterized lipoprotein NlpE involved in copper resistance